jgi:hypothetical protein
MPSLFEKLPIPFQKTGAVIAEHFQTVQRATRHPAADRNVFDQAADAARQPE